MGTSRRDSRAFRRVTIQLEVGDITVQRTDAIVNAANNRFWMGGGVAGAIKRAGGPVIEQEAMKLGPVEPGMAVTTSAGSLPCRHVIHAAVMGQDLQTGAGLVRTAAASALAEAACLDLNSVAFPALGTGVGGFPLGECGRLMIEAVLDHSRSHQNPSKVLFVLPDEPAFAAFASALHAAKEGAA